MKVKQEHQFKKILDGLFKEQNNYYILRGVEEKNSEALEDILYLQELLEKDIKTYNSQQLSGLF